MKALEKAAKDRGSTPAPAAPGGAERAEAAAPATEKLELSLEPLETEVRAEPATPPQVSPPMPPAPKPGIKTPPPALAAPPPRPASAKAEVERERAATVMQASAAAADLPPPRRRFNPMLIIGGIAALAVIGGAIYVYLQITNPAMFIRQPPAPPLTQKPPAPPAATPVADAPVTTAAVVAPAGPADAATAKPESTSAPATGAATAAASTAATTPARSAAAAPATPRAETPRDLIKVSPGSAEPQLDPRVSEAYAALQTGKLDAARQIYGEITRSDPRNVQALLGLAAVQVQEGQADEAGRNYARVLQLDPRNTFAQAGLVSLVGRADPTSAEARLKQLIAREPLPSLHFTLGNLYADQSRWPEAQQAYFQAHTLESGNPDYAYNLAVSLEHIGQPRLAAGFYRRAVELAPQRGGRVGFNVNQAQDRARQLAALAQ